MCLKRVCIFMLAVVTVLSASDFEALAKEEPSIQELMAKLNLLIEEVNSLKEQIGKLESEKEDLSTKTENLAKENSKIGKIESKLKFLEEKTKIGFSGEVRFRYQASIGKTPENFVSNGSPKNYRGETDRASWPVRARLNLNSTVIPDYLDMYGRFTLNKRFGSMSFFGTSNNPHDQYNSYAAHQGSDNTMRIENLYAITKLPYVSTEKVATKLWWGRLCAYEGPPSRTPTSPFPRLFVDSEIEGGLLNIEFPGFSFEKKLTEIQHRFLGKPAEPTDSEKERKLKKIARSGYFKKVEAKNAIYLGYIKYQDTGLGGLGGTWENLLGIKRGPDSDCFISQLQLKLAKDTQIFLDYLYMNNYYMPRYSFWETEGHNFKWQETYTDSEGNKLTIPFIKPRPYHLGGIWWDTQLYGLQLYGAHYWSHFEISPHEARWEFADGGTQNLAYGGDKFTGHAWFAGFNTGNLIHDKVVFWCDVTRGSDYWINPFNCKGLRRKGTVHYLTNNYFYNPGLSGDKIAVGYFPFSALVADTCLTYYLSSKCYLLLGNMYFNYDNHDQPIIGTSGRKQYWYPHIEWKVFF
jgi:FtsZ-binding cell division protein ZapB